jgi:two-component sensor histidine kinase
MPIHTLPIDVIHLIAAGEVIDSLGAVVRELCENAIDAGATRITVSLFPDRWRIRVADNGSGIELADLQVRVKSKIATIYFTLLVWDFGGKLSIVWHNLRTWKSTVVRVRVAMVGI